jgi:dTMP kinase
MSRSGILFVFEGPDGVGKTTLSNWFAEYLRTQGRKPVVWSSFPGNQEGTLGGLVYRLHHDHQEFGVKTLHPLSLQLVHVAAHVDAIHTQIRKLLQKGTTIVLDRFWWSTWVYGRFAGGDPRALDAIIEIERLVWGKIRPAKVFLISRDSRNDDAKSRRLARLYLQLTRKEASHVAVVHISNNGPLARAKDSILSSLP